MSAPASPHRRRTRKQIRPVVPVCIVILVFLLALNALRRQKKPQPEMPSETTASDASSAPTSVTVPPSLPDPETLINDEHYPEALRKMLRSNPGNDGVLTFVAAYPGTVYNDDEIDISADAAENRIPVFYQWDLRWAYAPYSGDWIGRSGCGPTCMSMAAVGLTGNQALNPQYVAQIAHEKGYDEAGTSWSFFWKEAGTFGLEAEELPLWDATMREHLSLGEVIICIVGPGDFTNSGHFILLTACQDGAYTVHDPFSRENTGKTWTYDTLSSQIRGLWAFRAAS